MTTQQLIAELVGQRCRCGSAKAPRQGFCRTCYERLPARLRAALYRRVGAGYEAAYQAAVERLDVRPDETVSFSACGVRNPAALEALGELARAARRRLR